jgi:cystathionine beta-lyase family protein involved in aluminum resistance
MMHVLKKIKIKNKVLIILRNLKYSWKYVIIRGEHKNIICMFKNTKESVLISIYATEI